MTAHLEIVRYQGPFAQSWERSSESLALGLVREGDVYIVQVGARSEVEAFGIDLVLELPEWGGGYVLVPGAVYDGNRFRVLDVPYPPMFAAEDGDAPMVTDVPRLPAFHLLSGDASFPALGLWNPATGLARAILFPAATDLGLVGLRVEEGASGLAVRLQFPGVRPERYTMVDTRSPSDDCGASVRAGWTMETRVAVVEAAASEVDGLFALVDANRHRCVEPASREPLRPLSSAAGLVHEVTMASRWHEKPGFFETADSDRGIPFQVGWTGGGITSFAMLESDDPLAQARARGNVDFVCEALQGASGFFGGGWGDGVVDDGFGRPHAAHWTMVRKNGDFLLFLMRHILAVEDAPPRWTDAARRCAEAFARNAPDWGQFVDVRDGRVVVGGSACGGTALAGMALTASVLDEPRYLEAARAAGKRYAADVERGLLTGGPGEILKAPDSESAFGLVEGYMGLWEATGEALWLDLAGRAARQAASWVVPYDFLFPPASTFGRLGMRTGGTVVANVQNKHGAPGICTLSGLSLLKLYRATGELRWLDLAASIAHALPQYVSSAERPIYAEGRPMPSGWINERVNLSDWEAPVCGVGEALHGPCWSMASLLLTALELPGVYVDPERSVVACLDHVAASLEGGRLRLHNPTLDDARVRVLVDRDPSRPLGELWWRAAPILEIAAGGWADYSV